MLKTYCFELITGDIASELRVVASSRIDALEFVYSFIREGVKIRFKTKRKPSLCEEVTHLFNAGFSLLEIQETLYTEGLEKLYHRLAKYTRAMRLVDARRTVKEIKRIEAQLERLKSQAADPVEFKEWLKGFKQTIEQMKRDKSLLPSISPETKKNDAPSKRGATRDLYNNIIFSYKQLPEGVTFDDVDEFTGGSDDE